MTGKARQMNRRAVLYLLGLLWVYNCGCVIRFHSQPSLTLPVMQTVSPTDKNNLRRFPRQIWFSTLAGPKTQKTIILSDEGRPVRGNEAIVTRSVECCGQSAPIRRPPEREECVAPQTQKVRRFGLAPGSHSWQVEPLARIFHSKSRQKCSLNDATFFNKRVLKSLSLSMRPCKGSLH